MEKFRKVALGTTTMHVIYFSRQHTTGPTIIIDKEAMTMMTTTNKVAVVVVATRLFVCICLLLLLTINHQLHDQYLTLHSMTVTATVTGDKYRHYQQQQQHQIYPCYQSSAFKRCHRKSTRRYPFVTITDRRNYDSTVSDAITSTVLSYTNKNIDETTTSTSSSSTTTVVTTTTTKSSLTGVIVDITLQHHRPLGCIIEESLATSSSSSLSSSSKDSMNKIVFVTSITSNGNAEQAGIMIGDVIIGISSNTYYNTNTNNSNNNNNNHGSKNTTASESSTSKDCTTLSTSIIDVTGYSIERLKSLIMCRYDDEPFTIRVLRGTTALLDHEMALTDICSNPDLFASSTETEQCMIDYIKGGYAIDNTSSSSSNTLKVVDTDDIPNDGECVIDIDDEHECLLNDMHSLWASDLPSAETEQSSKKQNTDNANDRTATSSSSSSSSSSNVVKPWSSRASPSGTFVRDPTTGKMQNLDSM